MKRSLILAIACAITIMPAGAYAQTNAIGPPLGLEFGMSYSEAKVTLKGKDIKLENLKEDKDHKTPAGFKIAKVGKYKLLDKKTDVNLACFNSDGELCAFQIMFQFYEGSRSAEAYAKSREFWESDLRKALVAKYSGEGFKEHKEPDLDGNIPELAFRDELGNEVGVFFVKTEAKILGESLGVTWWVIVYYSNEEINKATRKEQKSTTDL